MHGEDEKWKRKDGRQQGGSRTCTEGKLAGQVKGNENIQS